jgi:hypothetical protein
METKAKELYLNVSFNNNNNDNFDEFFENRSLKIVGVVSACFSMPVIFFLCSGIIWYERFGSGNQSNVHVSLGGCVVDVFTSIL